MVTTAEILSTTAETTPGTTARVEPVVEVRPLQDGDRTTLLEVFRGLSPRSRRHRFLTPKPRLTESELRQLTAVDHRDHVAIVAATAGDGRPVGIARFIRWADRPDSADMAVEVVDAWQHRGVGKLLTSALAQRALELGIRRFTVVIQSDNEAALRLVQQGREVTQIAACSGTWELEVVLNVG